MFCVLYLPSICQINSAQIIIGWLLLRGYLRVLQVRRQAYLTGAVIRCSEIVDTIRVTLQARKRGRKWSYWRETSYFTFSSSVREAGLERRVLIWGIKCFSAAVQSVNIKLTSWYENAGAPFVPFLSIVWSRLGESFKQRKWLATTQFLFAHSHLLPPLYRWRCMKLPTPWQTRAQPGSGPRMCAGRRRSWFLADALQWRDSFIR